MILLCIHTGARVFEKKGQLATGKIDGGAVT
jgi:hypothetical protein